MTNALALAQRSIEAGERDPRAVKREMAAVISAEPLARVDYIELVNAGDLSPMSRLSGRVLAALAVFIGKVRLIDNRIINIP